MKRRFAFRRWMIGALIILLQLSACTGETGSGEPQPKPAKSSVSTSSPASSDNIETETPPVAADSEQDAEQGYIDRVAQDTISKFAQSDMSEVEMAKAAFDYIIETTSLTEPVGLELWRIRGNDNERPSFVENRSLSVLLYGIGMCEDYAAALTMLLRGMGMEAEYVPGLTYSAAGTGLVDHSWTVAKIDGVWYHLDCQLEDNISRRDTTRYKYFMKGDAAMGASHLWGQGLIDSKLLTPEQNEEITRDFLYEPCPQNYPTPPPRSFTSAAMPDADEIRTAIESEFREYEKIHGSLEPLEINIIPPVFALEGYGLPD